MTDRSTQLTSVQYTKKEVDKRQPFSTKCEVITQQHQNYDLDARGHVQTLCTRGTPPICHTPGQG